MKVLLAMLLLMVVGCYSTDTVFVELPQCLVVDTLMMADSTVVVDSTYVPAFTFTC